MPRTKGMQVLACVPNKVASECRYLSGKEAAICFLEKSALHMHESSEYYSRCGFMVGCCMFLHLSPNVLCSAFFLKLPSGEKKPFFRLSKPATCSFLCVATLRFAHYLLCAAGASREIYGWTLHFPVGSRGSAPRGQLFYGLRFVCSS